MRQPYKAIVIIFWMVMLVSPFALPMLFRQSSYFADNPAVYIVFGYVVLAIFGYFFVKGLEWLEFSPLAYRLFYTEKEKQARKSPAQRVKSQKRKDEREYLSNLVASMKDKEPVPQIDIMRAVRDAPMKLTQVDIETALSVQKIDTYKIVDEYGDINPTAVCTFCGKSGNVRVSKANITERSRVNSLAGKMVGLGVDTEKSVLRFRCGDCKKVWDS